MRNTLLYAAVLLLLTVTGYSQTTVFTDDFESGTTNWVFSGTGSTWGLATSQSHSPTHSLSESPAGNYGANKLIYATMANGVDLTSYLSAELTFWGTYKIEGGFDYMYVDVSDDNYATYATIATFDGGESSPLPPFSQYTYSLSGYCGSANVKVRFRFFSDGGYETDGMYIDDFTITGSNVDNAPPMIVHAAREFYEGRLLDDTIYADIIDVSGIDSASIIYSVDGGSIQSVNGVNTTGNEYRFIMPAQTPGAYVVYFISATDASPNSNSGTSNDFEYISGNHIISDNGVVDFFGQFGPGAPAGSANGAAVKVVLGNTDLATILIRNYTDNTHPNDSMEIHIWNDNGGLPGTDVINPFRVMPAATLTNTSAMTIIDLRSYSSLLSALSGTFYIGFTVPTGIVNLTMTQPGVYNRSYNYINNAWAAAAGTGGSDDYHFRAVTSLNTDVEGPVIANDSLWTDYHSQLTAQVISAHITDMSGIGSADLTYWVDNTAPVTINPASVNGNVYSFTVPAQTAGSWVKYIFTASDNSFAPMTTVSDTFRYITGDYFKWDMDNPNVYVPVTTTGSGYPAIAEMIDFGVNHRDIVALLIRNYYSTSVPANTPNDSMEIHVWNDDAGVPGIDLITPFMVASEAGPNNTMPYTRVDFRGVTGAQYLTGINYVGFTVPVGSCAVLADTLNILGHSYSYNSLWGADPGNNFHMRIITSDDITTIPSVSGSSKLSLYPNPSEGYFFVDFNSSGLQKAVIIIYDISGKVVYEKTSEISNTTSVDLTNMSKGIYYLQVQKGDETYKHKVVIE